MSFGSTSFDFCTKLLTEAQRGQKLGGPVGQGEEELPLGLIENKGLVERTALGGVEQGQVAGHSGGSKS